MGPRTRILDAAMLVFRRQGFRRSSIEQAAEAAGLTRQALYHHFKSREELFRAVIERLHENALAAEIAAGEATEKAGGSLAEILIAEITARIRELITPLEGSPHLEELFSEHLLQARDLYQKYAAIYAGQLTTTVERVCRKQRLVIKDMTAPDFARCIEMAFNGTKSAYPAMQPADAFLRDFGIMVRMLVAGAVSPAPKQSPGKTAARGTARKPVASKTARKSGDRR